MSHHLCHCTLKSTSAVQNREAYTIVEEVPSESSDDDFSGSDDEWLPEKHSSEKQMLVIVTVELREIRILRELHI